MRRALPTPLFLALALVVGGQAHAQLASSPAAEPEKTSPASPAAPSPPLRAVSPETAVKLAAIAPKFVPPKTDDEKSAAPVDKPRNTIIHLPVILLPSYIVREPKLREFKQRELLTPKAKIELAYKKYPGLRFNPLFFLGSNAGIGLAMIEEEERLERMREMEDLLSLLRYSNDDPKGETATKARQTFIRHD